MLSLFEQAFKKLFQKSHCFYAFALIAPHIGDSLFVFSWQKETKLYDPSPDQFLLFSYFLKSKSKASGV
jgi:hypothetical protein